MKLIKFDLPLDGTKVKNLDELRDHFSAEVLEHCRSGLLMRWLRSRGLADEVAALDKLDVAGMADEALFRALCGVFGVEVDELILSAMFSVHATEDLSVDGIRTKMRENLMGTIFEVISASDMALINMFPASTLASADSKQVEDFRGKVMRMHYLHSLMREVSCQDAKILLGEYISILEVKLFPEESSRDSFKKVVQYLLDKHTVFAWSISEFDGIKGSFL